MILVVGSINMDICLSVNDIPRPGETVLSNGIAKNPGGKGANQAVAAAKLGGDVTMLGCVGDDEHGSMLLKSLSDAGVDTQYILQKDHCASSSAFICVADSGENSIVVDSSANMFVSPEYLLQYEHLFSAADYCVLQMEIPVETVKTAIELSKKHGANIVLNPSPVNGFDKSLLHGVSYLIPNETETSDLLGKDFCNISDCDLFAFMDSYSIENMIVTLGKDGCRYYHMDHGCICTKSAPKETVDTTGAGDTFLGAVVAALSKELEIKDALVFANTASGIAVTRRGAQQAMPTKQEVADELQKHSS